MENTQPKQNQVTAASIAPTIVEAPYTAPTTFPAVLEVPLRFCVRVSSAEEAAYYINPHTGSIAIAFLADLLDENREEQMVGELVSINGETEDSIRLKLQAEAV